jgi:hypothetical protein
LNVLIIYNRFCHIVRCEDIVFYSNGEDIVFYSNGEDIVFYSNGLLVD